MLNIDQDSPTYEILQILKMYGENPRPARELWAPDSTLLASSARNLPETLMTSFQARLSLPHVFDKASF